MQSANAQRGIFCNRTLNLNAVRAIGYDMDYTLIHYHMAEWEKSAYNHLKGLLSAMGWPLEGLAFDPNLAMRGLIIDTETGNVVKANRFGYIKRAFHGSHPIDFETQRRLYQRTLVDLSDKRWSFLNTLFSISEACLYMQLVDLLDEGVLPGRMGYTDLYHKVREALDAAHMEGKLKAEIVRNPERFVDLDEETALALLDQKKAGKKLLLITNSEWKYASFMMSYAFDRFLPDSMTWRDLFHIAVIRAHKPNFFSHPMPAFRLVSEEGFLQENPGRLTAGQVYLGGNAQLVEKSLGLCGEEILYVGDHIFMDVNISKSMSRWRTALVIRELEEDISAVQTFRENQQRLSRLMKEKEELEGNHAFFRLQLQRCQQQYGPDPPCAIHEMQRAMGDIQRKLARLDSQIGPLAQESSRIHNSQWGLLMRTGIDKSHLARQVERHADIYMSRVSNFLQYTPFAFLRSQRNSLPHDSPGEYA